MSRSARMRASDDPDAFVSFLVPGRLKASSGRSYVTYINNLCRNMVEAGTEGATSGDALDVLLNMARAANSEQSFLNALARPLGGPRGRSSDLRSAATQLYEYAREGRATENAALKPRDPAPPQRSRAASPAGPCPDRIEWLRNAPPSDVQASLNALLAQTIERMTENGDGVAGKDFDRALREALVASGCNPVSGLDTHTVLPGTKYTVDIAATAPDGTRLLVEVEKTEVKRIIHDVLKIAAGQKDDPGAVGLLIVPDRYRTKNRDFSRTHPQEARAVLDLLTHSHPWAGGALGVVVYSDL